MFKTRQFLFYFVLQIVSEVSNSEIICNNAHNLVDFCFSDSSISNSTKAFLKQSKIPYNTEEIQDHCNVFNRGIRCFQDYVDKCISDVASRRLLEGEITPAKNFYEMLCKDQMFRRDYLSHRNCFQFVKKDWEKCTNDFHKILDNEFTRAQREQKSNINTQYMHFCCARYSYAKCVGNSAKAKCEAKSAQFTISLIELLSNERQFKNCAPIEHSLCSSASGHKIFTYLLIFSFIYAFILNAFRTNV